MSSRAEAEKLWGHPLQYTFVLHTVAYPHDPMLAETGDMTDEQVFRTLAERGKDSAGRELTSQVQHQLAHPAGYLLRTERFNRCPTCEQWSPCDVRKAADRAGERGVT